ncbi:MAG: prolipoprotein diacylglyceryl transferase [Pirellulales bacterium]|nr:prolipoprotein diacylglyceryl transferase [Pirellulales bacterium]
MCSELFRIPLHWLSTPVWTSLTGSMLFIALLVLVAIGLFAWGKRSGRSNEVWGYLPGLLLLAAVAWFPPRLFPEGLPIRGYGVMVLCGSLSGIWLAVVRARQVNLNPDIIFALAFGLFICGIIGARLFFVIEYWDTRFRSEDWSHTLLEIVKFTEGGLVVYGSFIGATIAFLWFVRRHGLPALAMADLIAPSLLLGLAFGRIGCLLNGCCFGGESAQPWAVTFPPESMPFAEQVVTGRMHAVELARPLGKSHPVVVRVEENSPAAQAGLSVGMEIIRINGAETDQMQRELLAAYDKRLTLKIQTREGRSIEIPAPEIRARSLPVHPTQVYSAVNAGLLAWVLWSFYPLRRRDGEVTALMLTAYPVSRFLLEIIRVDESAVFGTGLSISQNISVVLFVAAMGLWIYLRRQKPARAVFAPLE